MLAGPCPLFYGSPLIRVIRVIRVSRGHVSTCETERGWYAIAIEIESLFGPLEAFLRAV